MSKTYDTEPVPPEQKKPGEIEVDVDDALIEEPKDDVFGDHGKKDEKPGRRPLKDKVT